MHIKDRRFVRVNNEAEWTDKPSLDIKLIDKILDSQATW